MPREMLRWCAIDRRSGSYPALDVSARISPRSRPDVSFSRRSQVLIGNSRRSGRSGMNVVGRSGKASVADAVRLLPLRDNDLNGYRSATDEVFLSSGDRPGLPVG